MDVSLLSRLVGRWLCIRRVVLRAPTTAAQSTSSNACELNAENWSTRSANFLTMRGAELAMKRKQFSDQQIAMALEQARAGLKVEDVCRKLGVSQNTFYRWRKKYGPMQPSEIKRLKQLEDENKRLKSIVADLTLDKQMLQEVLRKKD